MPAQLTMTQRAERGSWVKRLASPRWSVLFFLLTAAGSLGVIHDLGTPTVLMVPPFTLLVVNMVAGVIALPRFRADLPLLLFHLALLALVMLMVLARLIYLDGTTAVSHGAAFDGKLLTVERGPLHRGELDQLHFSNEGFTEDFFRQGKYLATYNRVGWVDESGMPRMAEVGDDRPLVIGNYRIYTTTFRGFSPVFQWQPHDGAAPQTGSVQLTYTGHETFGQKADWTLPDGAQAWTMLDFAGQDGRARAGIGAAELDHTLVLRIGDARHVIAPGDVIERPGGTLTYLHLDSWMGYRIIYDPTEAWIVATVIVGVLTLIWFYARRVFARLPAETTP